MARNALDLSIIARLAADGEDLQEIEGEAAPWEAYTASIDRENASALPPITDLAWAAAKARAMAIQIASAPPEAQLKTLLSRGVLVFDGRLRYRFRHERIRDYLVARDVARVGVSPRPLFDRLDGAGPSPRNPPQSGTLAEQPPRRETPRGAAILLLLCPGGTVRQP